MKPQRGYYSLIQFCPDASRMEVVNVGVVLFCPALDFLDVRTSNDNKRAEKLVGKNQFERKALNAAKDAIEHRFEVDRGSFQNIEDLEKFIDTRGNWLKLTQARPLKVFNPKPELEKLFEELVDEISLPSKKPETKVLFPTLDRTFSELHSEGRAQLNLSITIPVIERKRDIPYAYRNGRLNLVLPHRFKSQGNSWINPAEHLAAEGTLINNHGTNQCPNTRLIVVSSFDDENDTNFIAKVCNFFQEFNVRNITKKKIDEFVQEVEQEAHQNLTDSSTDS